jgi:alkyl hydroperoxide reductase subunit AhpF
MKGLLPDAITLQLKEYFSTLIHPVDLFFFRSNEQDCPYCSQTGQLLDEITALSSKLKVQIYDTEKDMDMVKKYSVTGTPCIVVAGRQNGTIVDYGIRFYGIPAGNELGSLVNNIQMVSMRDSGLERETKKYLATLKTPIHLEVFITPT